MTYQRRRALRSLMKIGMLACLLVATAACGAYVFPGETPSPTAATATVSGRVLAVPCAPVEKPGNTCAGRPVPNLEIDYLSGTAFQAKGLTGPEGSYSVQLSPGTYTVRLKTYMRVISGPLNLSVAAGSRVAANYVLDSGIRVPLPQQ